MKKSLSEITIVPLGLEHAPEVQKYVSEEEVSRTTLKIPHPYPANGADTFIRHVFREREEGKHFAFAILANGRLVGVCGVILEEDGKTGSLGYWMGRPFWNKGYTTAAVRLVIDYAFADLKLERIIASCLDANAGSWRVMEKNGMNLFKTEPMFFPKTNRNEQTRWYEIKRSAWKRRP